MKTHTFTAVGLFLVALHLKCSKLGIGPTITWFEVSAPILLLMAAEVIIFILDLFKITQRIDLFFAKMVYDLYVWQKKREALKLKKKIFKNASK